MAQSFKNLAAARSVTAEAEVQSLAWCSGLKDLALPQPWHRLQLRFKFNPWPGNFYVLWVWPQN